MCSYWLEVLYLLSSNTVLPVENTNNAFIIQGRRNRAGGGGGAIAPPPNIFDEGAKAPLPQYL